MTTSNATTPAARLSIQTLGLAVHPDGIVLGFRIETTGTVFPSFTNQITLRYTEQLKNAVMNIMEDLPTASQRVKQNMNPSLGQFTFLVHLSIVHLLHQAFKWKVVSIIGALKLATAGHLGFLISRAS